MLGDDADRHPVALVGASVTILDEEILALQVGAEALFDALEFLLFNRPIHLTPANFAFAGWLPNEELVLGQSARVLARAHYEWPEMTERALVTADGFFVKRWCRKVPMRRAEIA